MSPPDFMQLFLREVRNWIPRIKRATYASEVSVERAADGGVLVMVRWGAIRGRPPGNYRKLFTRARVLGRTASALPTQQRPVQRLCRFRDEVISEVLRARGI